MTDQQLNDDSPPDPMISPIEPVEPLIPNDTSTFTGSTAEPLQEEPELVVKKGRGAPRKDGAPSKSDSLAPPKTMRPMYKRFYSDAVNDNQKPRGFFRWCRSTPKWNQERLTFYVYRDWPTLKDPPVNMRGEKEDNKYIDKLAECPETVTQLLDSYGAGDYRIMANDSVVDMQTIAEIHIREGWRNVVNNPPTDRHIDDVDNVDLDSTANNSYVKYLKGKGKLPEQQQQQQRESGMAEASVMKEMTGLVRELISKKDDKGQNDTTATVVKEIMGVMGEVNKQAAGVMENAYKTTMKDQSAQVDPLEYLKAAAELMRPQQVQQGGGNSQVVEILKTYLDMESRRAEQAEKRANDLMEKLMEKNNPPPPPPPPPAQDALQTTEKTVESITKIANLLGLKARGEAAVVDGGSSWWKDNLPEIMQYGSGIIQAGVRAYEVSQQARMRQGQGMPPQQMPQQPNYIVPPTAIPDGQQQYPVQPEQPAQPDPQLREQAAELATFEQFASEIKRPLMNHINRNLGGAAFAQWIIDSYDDATYQQMRMAGAEGLVEGLKSYEPIWRELEPKQALLPQFVDEFMRMEEIVAAAEAEEEAEWAADGDGDGDMELTEEEVEKGPELSGIKLMVDR